MKKKFVRSLLIYIFAFSLHAFNAEALVLYQSFDDLVQKADLILEGTVERKESVWADDHSTIYTFVTFSEIEIIDGTYTDTTFTLRMDGGEVEEAGQVKRIKVSETPEFEIGERVVLFIRNNAHDVCPLVGWSQGKLSVKRDPKTGEDKLYSSEHTMEIAGVNTQGNFILKPLSALPQALYITIKDSDPKAEELRLKYEADREKERQKIHDMNYSLKDLKQVIKSKSKTFKDEGKKKNKLSTSANKMSHREGRAWGVGISPQINNGGNK